jgi:predicted NBD/HSP70 family sugar kinase
MIYVPSRMGQLNRRALLRRLQKLGVASRANLAKSLGMSQPTAGKIVDELLADNVIEEVDLAETAAAESIARGRPGRMLRLNRAESRFLAVTLGLSITSLAELPLGGADTDEWDFSFQLDRSEADPAAAWEKNLRVAARKIDGSKLFGVLLSVPGIVDETTNRILFSPNLHWTEKVDLTAIVRKIWDVPVLLVQEERALALGHLSLNPDCDDFLLVDFGEGVGGAVIMGGKPLENSLPISGEIGHTPVLGNRRQCGCGAQGCMETLVSLRGLRESFSSAQPGADDAWSNLQEYLAQNEIPAWLAQSLDAAAVSIAGALNILGLRRVVITGSLTELSPAVVAHLSRAIQNGSMWAKFGSVECVAAPRRRAAGLVAVGIDRLVVPEQHENGSSRPAFRRQTPKTAGKS